MEELPILLDNLKSTAECLTMSGQTNTWEVCGGLDRLHSIMLNISGITVVAKIRKLYRLIEHINIGLCLRVNVSRFAARRSVRRENKFVRAMVVANDSGNAYTPTVVAQIRYMLQWFGEWSEMERGDFLPALVHGLGVQGGAVNGLLPVLEGLGKEDGGRPLSLFKCRIKLFTEWVQTWSDDDKESFLSGLRAMDADFARRYEQKSGVHAQAANPPEYCNGVNGDNNDEDHEPEEEI